MNTVIYKSYLEDVKKDIEEFIRGWELSKGKQFPERTRDNVWRIAVVLWSHVRSNRQPATQLETCEVFGLGKPKTILNGSAFATRNKEAHRNFITNPRPEGLAYAELIAALKKKYERFQENTVVTRVPVPHAKRKYSTNGEHIIPSQIRVKNKALFKTLGLVMEDIVAGISYIKIQQNRDVTIHFIHTAYDLYIERSPVLISFSGDSHTVVK